MAYKFQRLAARMSGSLTQEGDIAVTTDTGTTVSIIDQNGIISGSSHLESGGNLVVAGTVTLAGVADTAIAVGSDGLYFKDADGTMKTDTVADLMTAAAGAGLAASSGVLSVDIDELSALGGAGLHQTQDHFMFSDNGTEKKITFSNLQDAVFADVSGDATIAAGGALTIAADAVEPSMMNIFDDSLAATDTHFMIADGTDYSSFALSGDVTCTNAGVVTIAATSVEGSMLNDNVISGQDALGGASMAQADTLLMDDGPGTVKKVTFSNFEDSIFANVSGDATIAAGGALTIASEAVEYGMLNSNVISGLTQVAPASGDFLMLGDTNDSNALIKQTVANVVSAGMSSTMSKAQFVITSAKLANEESEALENVAHGSAVSDTQDVYLNGQLLTAGSAYTDSAVVGGDYYFGSATSKYYFAFATEVGDVVTWIKRA